MANAMFLALQNYLITQADITRQWMQLRSTDEQPISMVDVLYSKHYRPGMQKRTVDLDALTRSSANPSSSMDLMTFIKFQVENEDRPLKVESPQVEQITFSTITTYIINYYTLAYGLYNGTRFYGGPQSIACQKAVYSYVSLTTTALPNDFYPPTPTCPSPAPVGGCPTAPPINYYQIVRDILAYFTNVQVVQTACVGAVYEAYNELLNYANGYQDIWGLTDAFANNFGLMYDSVFSAIAEITNYANPNYFMIGYQLGNILYLIFFTA